MQQSASIAKLAEALSKAQGEFTAVPFNTLNRFLGNRYADLGAVIEAAKPIIAAHGLSVAQLTEDGQDGAIGVTTILMHSSGEWLSSFVSLPLGEEKGKSRAQVAGSIVSYLRRYAYTSILGLYAEEETDANTDPNQTKANVREHGTHTVAQTAEGRFDPRSRKPAQQEPQEDILAYFKGRLQVHAKATEVPAAPFSTRARAVRDALLDLPGSDTALATAALKTLTGKELFGKMSTPELLSFEDALKADRAAAILAVAREV